MNKKFNIADVVYIMNTKHIGIITSKHNGFYEVYVYNINVKIRKRKHELIYCTTDNQIIEASQVLIDIKNSNEKSDY